MNHESDQDLRVLELSVLATAVFQSSEQASKWLVSPQKAFGGETPFNLASSDAGARKVRDLLGRIEHGVFS